MSVTYLLIGGNEGDRLMYLKRAVDMISLKMGKIIQMSSIYETEPYGFSTSDQFLNMCVKVETDLSPFEILVTISEIEISSGRQRNPEKYTNRKIDIDILFYDDIIINDTLLTIPHPELHKRNFALIPLAEINPGYVHPIFGKTIRSLLTESKDKHKVILFQDLLS